MRVVVSAVIDHTRQIAGGMTVMCAHAVPNRFAFNRYCTSAQLTPKPPECPASPIGRRFKRTEAAVPRRKAAFHL
jgi:hypothetical protein